MESSRSEPPPETVQAPAAPEADGATAPQTAAKGGLGETVARPASDAATIPAASEPAPAGIVLSRDLAFTAKVTGTAAALGYTMRVASDTFIARMQIQKWKPRLVFIDLTAGQLVAPQALRAYRQLAGPATWFVATGPHVQTDTLAGAKAAGCQAVMPRSQFAAQLPALMEQYFGQPADQSEPTEPDA